MLHIQLNLFITSGYFFSPETRRDLYVMGIRPGVNKTCFQKKIYSKLELLEGEFQNPTRVYRKIRVKEKRKG